MGIDGDIDREDSRMEIVRGGGCYGRGREIFLGWRGRKDGGGMRSGGSCNGFDDRR